MKIKKEYIKPEAEMLKFLETEEIMTLIDNKFNFASADAINMPDGFVI